MREPSLREHATQLGEQIRAEQGVAQAVEVFEQVIVRDRTRSRIKKGFSLLTKSPPKLNNKKEAEPLSRANM